MKIDYIKSIDLIEKSLVPTNSNSLLGGNAGIILFYIYLYKATNIDRYFNIANEMIEREIERWSITESPIDFGSGSTGFFWLLLHCKNENLISLPDDFFDDSIVDLLALHADSCLKNRCFDYFYGGLSSCMYYLEKNDELCNIQLQKITHDLEEISVKGKDSCYWSGTFFSDNGKLNDEINLGLAHGIPSIIAILSRIYGRGIEKDKCISLLKQSINFINSNRIENKLSIFPGIIEKATPPISSRMGWCYGDLGIAVSLWQAGKHLNSMQWKNQALEILYHSEKRRCLDENLIKDGCLCHGTAGIGLIYYRFYSETGEKCFKENAKFWFDQTIQMAIHQDGLAGYKNWTPNNGYINTVGLLEGISGIGLALISGAYEIEPKWDKCLLLS